MIRRESSFIAIVLAACLVANSFAYSTSRAGRHCLPEAVFTRQALELPAVLDGKPLVRHTLGWHLRLVAGIWLGLTSLSVSAIPVFAQGPQSNDTGAAGPTTH